MKVLNDCIWQLVYQLEGIRTVPIDRRACTRPHDKELCLGASEGYERTGRVRAMSKVPIRC